MISAGRPSSFFAALLLAFGLSACGSPESAPELGGVEAGPGGNEAATEPPAVQPPGSPERPQAGPDGAELPAPFRGRWDASESACAGRGSEMRLTIEPGQMRFHESVARVERVRAFSQGVAEVDLAFSGEGQSWTETRTLRLLSDGRLSVEAGGGSAVRTRCD